MTILDFEQLLNEWGRQRVPFLFVVDFEMKKPFAVKVADVNADEIIYNINGLTNADTSTARAADTSFLKKPIAFSEYDKKFQTVYRHLQHGDTYLANLTIKTEIQLRSSLKELFYASKARYKMFFKDEFLVFSPEIFVQIKDTEILSYPMKGTISKAIPDAAEKILNDQKELAEHVTIVDLIRNDLSQIAKHVYVKRFRFLDEIKTNKNQLLQVSSEIVGSLNNPYEQLGTILVKMLPAGSVSGAPKPKTIEVLRLAEGEERGYYTGVMGIFDGNRLDSGVIIRYIEKNDEKYFYRSGGGITTQSDSKAEYQEVLEKIYVPVN